MSEVWKSCQRLPDMEISTEGRVRHINSKKLRKGSLNKDGYLRLERKGKQYLFHHLVLEAFEAPKPADPCTRHLNGIKQDNRVVNLCWGTRAENGQDMVRLGEVPNRKRTNNGHSKLTERQVQEIRAKYTYGVKRTGAEALAIEYGVTSAQIANVALGRGW